MSHDRLLDYVYGELEGAERAAFEKHLAECAACQKEHELVGHVRLALKDALPLVDPPENRGLHAQLMHAAANRKKSGGAPERGKVIPFVRKIMFHPGFAAAASLLVVGGVVGSLMMKRELAMPAQVMEAKNEAAAPMAPAMPMPAEKAAAATDDKAVGAPVAAPAPVVAQPTFERKKSSAFSSDEALGSLDSRSGGSGAKAAPPRASTKSPGYALKESNAIDPFGDNDVAQSPRGYSSGATQGGAGTLGAVQNEKKSAERASVKRRDAAPDSNMALGGELSKSQKQNVADGARLERGPAAEPSMSAPASPRAQAPQKVLAEAEIAPKDEEGRAAPRGEAPESIHARAKKLASAGQCSEANTLFALLDKQYPNYKMTPQDRLAYVQCLRAANRSDLAQTELDAINRSQSTTTSRAKATRAAKPAAKAKAGAAADTAADAFEK